MVADHEIGTHRKNTLTGWDSLRPVGCFAEADIGCMDARREVVDGKSVVDSPHQIQREFKKPAGCGT